jgi:CRP-like cAMP-binding protein
MLAKIPERKMHSVRMVLSGGWLLLIASMFYDPFTEYLTNSSNLYSPFHINSQAACFSFQNECLKMHPYPLGPRLFWGMVVPSSILILIVLGHETWRRICPLSFLSQIPRALGIQRRKKVINPVTQSIRSELVSITADSWLGRNSTYCQFGLLFIGLNIRLLFANSDRGALGVYLLMVIAAAIGVGYLYAGKTWCHYFCPMGAVQTIYTGPRSLTGSQAHQSQQAITQSMCRTTDATGVEQSACVSCNSPCLDIDAERTYWENINKPGQKLLYYGYVGLVLGFFLYFPLYTGNWNFLSGPVWNETNQLTNLFRSGFYIFGQAIPIPKLLAVPLTLGGFTAASYYVGLTLDKSYQKYSRRIGSTISPDLIQHRGFVIATFVAFNCLFFLGVSPTLSWLWMPGQQLLTWSAIIAITMWAYQSWNRSSEQYTRENLASGLRRQLKKLGIDFSQLLGGRSLEQLEADEVYVLAKTIPGLNRERRTEIYRGLLQESLSTGQVSSVASLTVFNQLRQKLELTDQEHNDILNELGVVDAGLFNPSKLVSMESQVRVASYRQFLEILLIELVEGGIPLSTAMELKHRQISALKQEYLITPAEEAEALASMGQENSVLVQGIHALTGQLQALNWYDLSLTKDANSIPSIQLLKLIVQKKQQLVFRQLLGILEILGDDIKSQSMVAAIASLYGQGLETVWESIVKTDEWNLRLSPQIVSGLTPQSQPASTPQYPTATETTAVLQELWQDMDPLTKAAGLDAIYQLQPELARTLVQKTIHPHPDKLVQEVMQRVQDCSIRPELVSAYTVVGRKPTQEALQQPVTRQLDTLQKLIWLFQCNFLDGIGLETLVKLAASAQVKSCTRGSMICEQGQPVQEICLVLSGFARKAIDQFDELATIEPETDASVENSTDLSLHNYELSDRFQQVGIILPGETIGCLSALANSNHEFTIIAGAKSGVDVMNLITITAHDFKTILGSEPQLAKHLVVLLSKKLQTVAQKDNNGNFDHFSNLN